MSAAKQRGPLEEISDRENSIMLLSFNVENLAGLIETLSDAGYGEASAADDEWQKRWWAQAGYIADALADIAEKIRENAEAVGSARYTLQGAAEGRSAAAPARRSP